MWITQWIMNNCKEIRKVFESQNQESWEGSRDCDSENVQEEKASCKVSVGLHWAAPSPKSYVLTSPTVSLERPLRAIWGAASQAAALFLPQIKLSSQKKKKFPGVRKPPWIQVWALASLGDKHTKATSSCLHRVPGALSQLSCQPTQRSVPQTPLGLRPESQGVHASAPRTLWAQGVTTSLGQAARRSPYLWSSGFSVSAAVEAIPSAEAGP